MRLGVRVALPLPLRVADCDIVRDCEGLADSDGLADDDVVWLLLPD